MFWSLENKSALTKIEIKEERSPSHILKPNTGNAFRYLLHNNSTTKKIFIILKQND